MTEINKGEVNRLPGTTVPWNEIVEKMEMEDISLEESIRLFERGVRLTRYCSEKLDEAEGKITMILERNTHNEKKTTFDID